MHRETEDLVLASLPGLKELLSNPALVDRLFQEKKVVNWKAIEELYTDITFQKQVRAQRERQEAAVKYEQDMCPHLAGGLGEDSSNRTSIVWHQLNTEEIVGICLECGRKFWPSDEDYWTWRRKPSFNRMSGAGIKSRLTGYEEEFSKTYLQDDLYRMLDKERESQGGYAYPAEGLDALSDSQIKFLMEGIREYRRALKDPTKYLEEEFSKPERSV